MRHKYRSAIYVFDDGQAKDSQQALVQLEPQFDRPLITQVLPFSAFDASDERFRNYYASDPERPFCQTHIAPKLAKLRALGEAQ